MDQFSVQKTAFTRYVLITVAITAIVVVVLLIGWYFAYVLLLLFAGVLLAVLLRGLANWLSRRIPLATRWSLVLIIILPLIALGGGLWLAGPSIAEGFQELQQSIPRAKERIQEFTEQQGPMQSILERMLESDRATLFNQDTFRRIAGLFSTTLGVLAGILIILANGIYFSVEPRPYINGVVQLVPKERRGQARAVFEELGHVLRWWLAGMLISMTVVGTLSWLGLLLLGVPGAAALGLLAGLLSFIPNLGPILSAVPAVVVGWTESSTTALYVVLLYLGIQTLESYLITPLVQRRTIQLPPAVMLTAQLAMGIAFGVLGLLLAVPLALVVLVLVQMLYMEDVLKDEIELP